MERTLHRSRKQGGELLREVFLPEGYPHSVSADYARYQLFDSLQAFCSSVTGLLAHRAVLQGVGVGNELATVSSALLQWTIKDGSGMLSRIAFGWATGSALDVNAKTWRFMADILNDLALLLEMVTAHFDSPAVFLLCLCLASMLRALVGV
ncbi:MAG: RUS1 family protein [archaeon]|nr:RUS1 family protein [archaeon]